MRLFHARAIAMLLLPGLVGCADSDPMSPGEPLAVAGTYAAATGEASRFGAVTFTAESDASRDMLAEGASIVLDLHPDGTTSGRLFVPGSAGEDDFDEDLAGTWVEENGIVRLDHAADTFLRDMDFAVEAGRLVGDAGFGGVDVHVTLEPISPDEIEDLGSQVGDFQVTAVLDVEESFPVQLSGAMTFRNPGPEIRTLVTGVCWPLLRAYRPGEDTPVWDQLEEGACAMFTTRLDVVAPGDSVRFQTPLASAADVLDDELPDGTYRITVYFSTIPDGEIELEAGEVELAIPR